MVAADVRAPIFAALRNAIGPLNAQKVMILDAALDEIGVPRAGEAAPSPKPAPQAPAEGRAISQVGIDLIKEFEGCGKRRADGRLDAYPDPGSGSDPWTIGWGSTGPGIRKGTIWTQQEADARLAEEMKTYAREVSAAIGKAPTTQNQFDALVSFHYNTGAIARATLTKYHVAGKHASAAGQFALWDKSNGKVLAGLTRRRAAEAKLYRGG